MWRVALGVTPDLEVKLGPRTEPIYHEPLKGGLKWLNTLF